MRNLVAIILLCTLYAACAQVATPIVSPKSSAIVEPATSPTTDLSIQLAAPDEPLKVSRESLLTIRPHVVTLAELFTLVGHPRARKDFTNEIALSYTSELGKLPHIVLVDSRSGSIELVAIYNHNNAYFSLGKLVKQYGDPILAATINSRDHLFFAGQGVAVIAESKDNNDIWYVQLLPKDMTLDGYQSHQGYWQETFAFTP